MTKFLIKMQEGRLVIIFLLFLISAGVGATENPRMFHIIMSIVTTIVGSIAMVKLLKKWKSGDSDLLSTSMGWFGSFFILLMGNNIIASLFIK